MTSIEKMLNIEGDHTIVGITEIRIRMDKKEESDRKNEETEKKTLN